jgi:hypothetical protein
MTAALGLVGCGKKKTSPEKEAVDRGIRLEQQAQEAIDKNNAAIEDANKYLNPEP